MLAIVVPQKILSVPMKKVSNSRRLSEHADAEEDFGQLCHARDERHGLVAARFVNASRLVGPIWMTESWITSGLPSTWGTVRRLEYNKSAHDPMTSGTKLGPYEIQFQLGAGVMGEVYRARDPRLGHVHSRHGPSAALRTALGDVAASSAPAESCVGR